MKKATLIYRTVTCTLISLVAVGFFIAFSRGTSGADDMASLSSLNGSESVYAVSFSANDLVYNPTDGKLYMSVPGSSVGNGNSIQTLDPTNGQLGQPIFAGSEPNKLAISETGHALYVSLDGSSSIKRFITSTMESDVQFSTGGIFDGTRYRVRDMAVPPGFWNIIAVTRHLPFNGGIGVTIFNNGLQAPQSTQASDFLAFASQGSLLYATGQGTGLKTISVTENGASVLQTSTLGAGREIRYSQGKIFTSAGQVIDPVTNTLLGTFPGANTTAFTPDANGRAYYLVKEGNNTFTLKAFSIDTFALIGTLTINGIPGDATRLVRWGQNGLAFRTSGERVVVIQTALIPTAEPVPTPSATPATSPTPTPTPFATNIRYSDVRGNGLAYDSSIVKFHVSVPSSAPSGGNGIVTLDPETGVVGSSTFVGSEPGKLLLTADKQSLYVHLEGARTIRKFNLATQTGGLEFPVGFADGPLRAVDFAVSPDPNDIVAVSRCAVGLSPCWAGTAIFENGIQRPATGPAGYAIDFGASSQALFGAGANGGVDRMTVGTTGITNSTSMAFEAGIRMEYEGGRVYTSRGQVIDPATSALLGTFPLGDLISDNPRFVVDSDKNRIFYLTGPGITIRAFELDTFRAAGILSLTGIGSVTDFKRWGANGFAITHNNAATILVRSALVDSSVPVPSGTPPPVPTPTPTPAPGAAFVRRVDLFTNSLAFNPADQLLYATVPGSQGAEIGNTITRIDPLTGTRVGSVFVGSEPTKLALSDDGHTMYTTLNGANAIRRYDRHTQTPGQQFIPTYGAVGIDYMSVVPGRPQSLVVTYGQEGAEMYENGVKLPNVPREPPQNSGSVASIGPVVFGGSLNLLYGFNNVSTAFDFYKVAVDQNGLSTISRVPKLISGFGAGNEMKFAEGKVFTNSGVVVDPEANRMLGTYLLNSSGSTIAIDTQLRRVFIAGQGSISVYDMDTYLKIGFIALPNNGSPSNLVRWGLNGLAVRVTPSSAESFIYSIQSPLVSAEVPIPTGIFMANTGLTAPENSVSRTVTIARNGDLSRTSTIDYSTVDGTAKAGADYTARSGTLTFANGEGAKTISIPIINDNVFEGPETLTVNLSNPGGEGATILSPQSLTVTITDNDARPSIAGDDVVVNEPFNGGTTPAIVVVRLSNPSTETIQVNFSSASGTATSGSDYRPAKGNLTFAPLETLKTVSIEILGDNAIEAEEVLSINLTSPVNATVADSQMLIRIKDYARPPTSVQFDYDGDGKSDLSVLRSTDNTWYLLQGTAGYTAQQFGEVGDRMAPADYDGDGKTDVAVFRPSTGAWFVFASQTQTFQQFGWGANGDLPVPIDRDNDGKADLVVYRESNNTWYTRYANGTFATTEFGVAGDKPLVGDFDGDGIGDIALFRPSNNNWYILKSSLGFFIQTWGATGDIPVPADFDGDGATDQGVFRPSTGQWFLSRTTAGFGSQNWGQAGDIPVAADYDGDGKADVAVFRPTNGTWYIVNSSTGQLIQTFGQAGDVPTQSSYL